MSAVRRREKNSLFKILIDTCVWLDLAKDYQQQPILTALEELIRMGDIELHYCPAKFRAVGVTY